MNISFTKQVALRKATKRWQWCFWIAHLKESKGFQSFAALLAPLLLAQTACAEPAPASFAYVLQADSFARTKPAAVERLAACGRDWIVLDAAFSTDTPWEREDVDAVRRGQPGRKVIAYISIGEAEDYRPYWRKEWGSKGKLTAAAPAWLGAENPEWQGNYRVRGSPCCSSSIRRTRSGRRCRKRRRRSTD